MKNILTLSLSAFALYAQAQFTVQGKIENLVEKPLTVKIYKSSTEQIINKITTDKTGNFSVKVPEKYSGMVKFTVISNNASVEILSDNEDVSFTAKNVGNQINDVKFTKGKTAIAYAEYEKYDQFNQLKTEIFPTIKALYSENDEFFKAIKKEEERITKLSPDLALPLMKYYVQTANLIKSPVDNLNAAEVHRTKILNKLINDNNYLEGSGLLSQLVLDYLRYAIIGANSQEEINTKIDQEIKKLLADTDIETFRGQNVLTAIFNVLPKEQFANILEKYYAQASSLTCEMTDELKSNISAHKSIQVGSVVPNIVFDKPINGVKSLHEIKAKKKIVMFWASWCPACNDEMPFVKEYYRNFKAEGGEILSIALDFDKTAFEETTKDIKWFNYTELLRWDTQGVKEFGVTSTPTLYLLDENNKLIKTASHISELVQF